MLLDRTSCGAYPLAALEPTLPPRARFRRAGNPGRSWRPAEGPEACCRGPSELSWQAVPHPSASGSRSALSASPAATRCASGGLRRPRSFGLHETRCAPASAQPTAGFRGRPAAPRYRRSDPVAYALGHRGVRQPVENGRGSSRASHEPLMSLNETPTSPSNACPRSK